MITLTEQMGELEGMVNYILELYFWAVFFQNDWIC